MLAMQYSFTLPADFDMAEIRSRIATRGHLLDDFPGLVFKAYLYACRGEHGPENLYAPFYLWAGSEGMNRFLTGDGFVALTQSFGWPSVKTWSVLHAATSPDVREARFASRDGVAIPAHADLAALRDGEVRAAQAAVDEDGALAAVTAFEPTTWTLVRLNLWRERRRDLERAGTQVYEVGHVSAPAIR